jgi:signal peptidase I
MAIGTSFFDLERSGLLRLRRVSVDRPKVERSAVPRSRGSRILSVVVVSVIALVATAMITSAVGLWRAEVVLSGSMRPSIPPGSIELFLPEPTKDLRVGQVVAFHPPKASFVVTHRVIAIDKTHGVWITTKGDANNATDPWGKVRVKGGTVWVVHGVIPDLGYVTSWARGAWPRIAVLVTAVVVAGWLVLQRIWRS